MCGAVDLRSTFVTIIYTHLFSLMYRAADLWLVDVLTVDSVYGWSVKGTPCFFQEKMEFAVK